MSFKFVFASAFVVALVAVVAAQNMAGNETDRVALLAIKARISDDPFQIMSSWNNSLHFCRWNGVTCGRRHQRVTQLHLKSLNLNGQISPWISNLSFVRSIDLSNNNLAGEIPPEIERLSRLRELILGNNSLVGKIPRNLFFCSELRILYLKNNRLSGKIPPELGLFSRLEYMSGAGNNLTGEIPSELGNLTSLRILDLGENNLEGVLPDSLGRLKSLFSLQTSTNYLSGTIPRSIYNLTKLTHFFIGGNEHEGRIPEDIGVTALPNIEWFNVFENHFNGPIPVSFANASNLFSFQISVNGFSGGVPDIFGNLPRLGTVLMQSTNLGSGKENDLDFFTSLANCTNLRILILTDSNFGGKFPTSIANFSKNFENLQMTGNLISGEIPNGIGNLINLHTLFARNNLLSGNIPSTLGKLKKLESLSLSSNRLSGEIPFALGNLTSLLVIMLKGNNLRGIIPSSIRNCDNLEFLSLSSNNLDGTIPEFISDFPFLSILLDLSRNNFSGSLPSRIGNLKALNALDVSHNRLSGAIPQRLGEAAMLRELYMDHNMFEGKIPESLSSLRGIEKIDLSQNNLSGEIPKDLAKLVFLVKLNLSFNHLEGEVPVGGVFSNASAISVTGNLRLCGGITRLKLQRCTKKNSSKHGLFRKHKGKFIISIVFGVLALSLALFLTFSWWFKKRIKKDVETSSINPLTSVSYGDLLKATGEFASENLIGEGSIGLVYKGVLEEDQTAVAVKVFNLEKRGASKSFTSECETLKGVRHRNLVKIVTACSSIDYQGNEFKALVYELMPNGNLDNLLHNNTQNGELNLCLDFSKRIDIAIDVASAVDYLHNNLETTIVHCDIKPSNVLLDQENHARLGDFGLSRIIPHENPEISNNNQSSSSGLKGTIGYAAPEYGMGSKVSKEGDVYSFGILLLEIFTGKRPTFDDFGNGLNLNQYVNSSLPERVTNIVDQGIIPMEESNVQEQTRKAKICECCISVLKIGVMCSDEFPRARMKIDEALKQLLAAKKMLRSQ